MLSSKWLHNPKTAWLRAAFILILLVAVLLPTASPASAATCTQYHTVKRGETLYGIGMKYGVSWKVLAEINDLENPRRIYTGQVLCVSTSGSPAKPSKSSTIPTFSIIGVVKDQSVTIQTANFPANDTFDVLMGKMGTRAVNGVKVDRIGSGKGGTFTATFTIPSSLIGDKRIAIRLQSATGSGYYAYNWFYNSTSGSSGGNDTPGEPGYSGIPTFKITGVVRNSTVTIRTNNFPANQNFDVRMGAMGTRGVNGIKIERISSGSGGELSLTFEIPATLHGSRQIAIRLESPDSGYYSYNWFYNNTTR
jgi:LysM repeat protein